MPRDFLTFALDLVADEMGINREILRPIERKIRHDQGGDMRYIASNMAVELAEKHAAIRAAIAAGTTVSAAVERFGMSRQSIHRLYTGRPSHSKSKAAM